MPEELAPERELVRHWEGAAVRVALSSMPHTVLLTKDLFSLSMQKALKPPAVPLAGRRFDGFFGALVEEVACPLAEALAGPEAAEAVACTLDEAVKESGLGEGVAGSAGCAARLSGVEGVASSIRMSGESGDVECACRSC